MTAGSLTLHERRPTAVTPGVASAIPSYVDRASGSRGLDIFVQSLWGAA